jgi:hypothetical protein
MWQNPSDSIFGGSSGGETPPPPIPPPLRATDINFPFQPGDTTIFRVSGGALERLPALRTGVAPGAGFIPALGWEEQVTSYASFNTINVYPTDGEAGILGAKLAIGLFKKTDNGYQLLGKTPIFAISNEPDVGINVVIAQPLGATVTLDPGDQLLTLVVAKGDILTGDTDDVETHGLQALDFESYQAQVNGATGATYTKSVTTNINPYNANPARIANIETAQVGDQLFLGNLLLTDITAAPLRAFPVMRLYATA